MTKSGSLRLTTIGSLVLVVIAAALSVAGPANVFSLARRAERVRNSIDTLSVVQRSVAQTHARHRSYLIDPTPVILTQYQVSRQERDALLNEVRISPRIDSTLAPTFARLQAEIERLDAFRQTVIVERATSLNGVRQLLATDAAATMRNDVDQSLSTLEAGFRARLATLQPELERRRRLVLTGLPAILATTFGLLLWLYWRLVHESEIERARAAHYREMVDESPDGVMVHSDGLVLYANAQAAQILGLPSADDVIGRRAIDFVDTDDHDAIVQRTADVVERDARPPLRTTRCVRADGAVVEIETRAARIDFERRKAVEVTMRDVGERRARERAVALSEQRLRILLQSMEEGVVLQDESMNIVLWNAAAERILGLSGDQLAGRTSYDPAWAATDEFGDALPGDRHIAAVAMRTGRPASGVMGLDRGDGRRAWLSVSAVPMLRDDDVAYAVVGTFTDITLQRETARRLAESEARYRLITDHAGDLITLRSADDTLLYASPSHERVLGWTPDEMVGKPGARLVHPDDQAKLTGRTDALFDGRGAHTHTLRVLHKAGYWVWLEVVASPIASGNGSFSSFVVTARDITERLQLEEEVRQSQKMQSLVRVASAVAHDFNNLMTAVRASAELLLDSESTPTDIAESVAEITAAIDRAAILTTQLLAFARRQHVVKELVSCADVVRGSRALLTRLLAPRVTIDFAISPLAESAKVRANVSQVEQVLFNLVVNARDATSANGSVLVTLDRSTLTTEQPSQYGAIKAGDYVILTVIDHGTGMSLAVLGQLFEPFYTTKAQGRGTGLGLSTVDGIVRQHGGGITVESSEGKGTKFKVFLPVIPDVELLTLAQSDVESIPDTASDATAATRPPVLQRRSPETTTLLLVDDENAVRRTVAKALQHQGFRVLQVASGAEAMDLLVTRNIGVDAIVTDVRMPVMSGVDLVAKLFRHNIDIPVLFISGQIDDPFPADWPSAAPRHFLRKPFSIADLSDAVGRLIQPER